VTVTLQLGKLRQTVTLSGPGTPAADGTGGYTLTYSALNPATWRAAIEKATVKKAEKHFGETVLTHAMYILSGRYHSGIDNQTRMVWTDRGGVVHTANVLDVNDSEGAGVETVVLVSEVTS
jgi:hypothetical protein